MAEHEDRIPFALPDLGEDEIAAAVAAMRSGWLTTGPEAKALEQDFVELLGGGLEAVAVNSATAGLHLALEALGIGAGDEVIVPTWTFTATAEVVRYLGATPVLVDVEPSSLCLDLERAAAAVTERTAAVMPVHFAGVGVDRNGTSELARKYGLAVVEDAAHSFPAVSGGAPVGVGASEAVVFSFYATKTVTTGEGGMVVTQDPALAARARTMRLHGISRDVFDRYRATTPSWRYDVVAPGFKYNLTDPAAAMGRVQLRRAEAMRDRRAAIAAYYREALADLPLDLPDAAPPGDVHSWHLFVIRLRDDSPVDRDTFIASMAEAGVGCSVHFVPLHMHTYWRESLGVTDANYPVATGEFPRVVSLPIYSGMSDAQVERVARTIRTVLA